MSAHGAAGEPMHSAGSNFLAERSSIDCINCPSGFFDGCNQCACSGGIPACTKMSCSTKGEPLCTTPSGTVDSTPAPAPAVDCTNCPSGFFDGCNHCSCSGDIPACIKISCATKEEPMCTSPSSASTLPNVTNRATG